MMHQRDQRVASRAAPGRLPAARRSARPSTTIGRPGRQRSQSRHRRRRGCRRVGRGKPSPRSSTSACQPSRPQLGDHAPVIGIAAGWCRKIARDREHGRLHHNGASYQARATGDSAIVTRMEASSRPSRPSLPSRAAVGEPVEEMLGQKFGRGVDVLELRQLVEILVVERRAAQPSSTVVGARDVDDDAVRVERLGEKGHAYRRRSRHGASGRGRTSRRGTNGRS